MRKATYRARQRGMTLMEIMIVLVILGMIASVVTWNIFKAKEAADIRVAGLNIQGLRQAVISYRLRTNEFPEALDELSEQEIERNRTDPWGSAWLYAVNGDKFTIHSPGPDRLPNTPDDVTGEEPPPVSKHSRN